MGLSRVVRVWNEETITASGSISTVVNLKDLTVTDLAKLVAQTLIASAGAAVVTITYKHSLDGVTFIDIAAANAMTAGLSPGSALAAFTESPIAAEFLEITATESGAVDADLTLDIGAL